MVSEIKNVFSFQYQEPKEAKTYSGALLDKYVNIIDAANLTGFFVVDTILKIATVALITIPTAVLMLGALKLDALTYVFNTLTGRAKPQPKSGFDQFENFVKENKEYIIGISSLVIFSVLCYRNREGICNAGKSAYSKIQAFFKPSKPNVENTPSEASEASETSYFSSVYNLVSTYGYYLAGGCLAVGTIGGAGYGATIGYAMMRAKYGAGAS